MILLITISLWNLLRWHCEIIFHSQCPSVRSMWVWYNCREMVIESYCSPMRSPWCSDENLGRSLSVEVRSKFVSSFIINNLFIVRIHATFPSYISLVVSGLGYRLWWNLTTESLSLWVFLNCQLFLPLLLFLPNIKCHHCFFLVSEMLRPGGKPAGFSGWTLLSAIPSSDAAASWVSAGAALRFRPFFLLKNHFFFSIYFY